MEKNEQRVILLAGSKVNALEREKEVILEMIILLEEEKAPRCVFDAFGCPPKFRRQRLAPSIELMVNTDHVPVRVVIQGFGHMIHGFGYFAGEKHESYQGSVYHVFQTFRLVCRCLRSKLSGGVQV